MKKLRILVVEDDVLIGMLLAELLVGLGHIVCGTASNEVDAVAAAARHRPDLIMVDVNLTRGSGLSAIKTILETGAMPHVFMTGAPSTGIPTNATVLKKPFSEDDLTRALEKAGA